LPEMFGGWIVEEHEEPDDSGGTRYHRVATRAWAPDEPLPATWAGGRALRGESALRCATTSTMDRRRDGTWYHFRRVYEARRWAPFAAIQAEFLEPALTGLGDGGPITAERRDAVASALARHDAERMLLIGREVYLEISP